MIKVGDIVVTTTEKGKVAATVYSIDPTLDRLLGLRPLLRNLPYMYKEESKCTVLYNEELLYTLLTKMPPL